MIEALYGIEFVSNSNDGGFGVAVLETGRVFGGDSSFVFIGSYESSNGNVTARIKCTNDRKLLQSIFGDINEFNLELSGTPDKEHKEFILQGHMVENPSMKIGVKLTRRAELP
ncbi:GrlR family regulatory protein [Marinimicrobium sp. LS-A18]|uniref:GrlR family regulatory protein n=1 Tax=Marinimicrobium sp. LS-A18 TaxID=1381596 RepID=UPI0004673B92|nr:GrlR family regulatory protein [Marinimicrobium sp. LS-A18]